jgi:hypothetical protein
MSDRLMIVENFLLVSIYVLQNNRRGAPKYR